MTTEREQQLAEWIERRLNETISEAEFAELETALLEDGEARRLFLDLTHQHASLQMMGDSLMEEELHAALPGKGRVPMWGMGAAAALVLGMIGWSLLSGPKVVATLVSSEHAAWESSLPTTPNADLAPGFLKLKSGVATIRFRSGAVVILEAPAHLVLETPMRGRLLAGSAVIDVPESAIGFVMETPDGFAVDHGTQFAVSVNAEGGKSEFEVLSGEISVHHPESGDVLWLNGKEAAMIGADGLGAISERGPETAISRKSSMLRIGTDGRETSIIQNNEPEFLHPDFLMAKESASNEVYRRRALFAFDVSEIDLGKIRSARIRLNQVPSGLGFAARLPETNVFAIYGLVDEAAEGWSTEALKWEDAPGLDQCRLLGKFEVPRSLQTGSFGIETAELVEFLAVDTTGIASFILTRVTDEEKGSGLVHAFASHQHPEASGPALEIEFQ